MSSQMEGTVELCGISAAVQRDVGHPHSTREVLAKHSTERLQGLVRALEPILASINGGYGVDQTLYDRLQDEFLAAKYVQGFPRAAFRDLLSANRALLGVWLLARRLHTGQVRKDGLTAYFSHVERTAMRMSLDDAPGVQLALLHDVLDMHPGRHKAVLRVLRKAGVKLRILRGIARLTRREDQTYQEYIKALSVYSLETRVKRADIMDNLADDPTPTMRKRYTRALATLAEADHRRNRRKHGG